jgi:hypothetical protein
VLEPAAGRGHLSLELKRAGLIVESFGIRAYKNPLVPDIGLGDIRKLESLAGFSWAVTHLPYGDLEELAEILVKLGTQDRCNVALLARMADCKSAPQVDSLTSLVSGDGAADVPAAVGGADEGQWVAAAQFLLVHMGRATAPRGCMDPMGGGGPAKPHRTSLSVLHFEGKLQEL